MFDQLYSKIKIKLLDDIQFLRNYDPSGYPQLNCGLTHQLMWSLDTQTSSCNLTILSQLSSIFFSKPRIEPFEHLEIESIQHNTDITHYLIFQLSFLIFLAYHYLLFQSSFLTCPAFLAYYKDPLQCLLVISVSTSYNS